MYTFILISLQYPKSYFMVVAIGAANDFMTQLSKLATTDSHGNKMIFGLKDFKNFAHVAYYFHKGLCVGRVRCQYKTFALENTLKLACAASLYPICARSKALKAD